MNSHHIVRIGNNAGRGTFLYQIKILSKEDYDSRGSARGLTEGDKQQNLEGLEQQARLQQQKRETNRRWKAMEIEEQRQVRREQACVNVKAG